MSTQIQQSLANLIAKHFYWVMRHECYGAAWRGGLSSALAG